MLEFGKGILSLVKGSTYSYSKQGTLKNSKIDSMDIYEKLYRGDPTVRELIDLPFPFVKKQRWKVIGTNEEERGFVERFFRRLPLATILESWLRDSRIFGIGFLEISKNNLILRHPKTFECKFANNGSIEKIFQKLGNETVEFERDEVAILTNKPISDDPYGTSDCEAIYYIVKYLKDQAERDVGAMLNQAVVPMLDVSGGTPENPFKKDKIAALIASLNDRGAGEHLVHSGDVKITAIDLKSKGSDFEAYFSYILTQIAIGLSAPANIFSMTNPLKELPPTFSAFIQSLLIMVEDAINTQIIPSITDNLLTETRFVYDEFDVESKFIRTKADMVEARSQIKTPAEIRAEQGLPPVEEPEVMTSASPMDVPIFSKGEVAKKPDEFDNMTGDRSA